MMKTSPPPNRRAGAGATLLKHSVQLQISTKLMFTQLAGDTHSVTHTRPSDLLHFLPPLRERAQCSSSKSSPTQQLDNLGSGTEFEVDSSFSQPPGPADSTLPPGPADSLFPPGPTKKVDDPSADFAFIRQFSP